MSSSLELLFWLRWVAGEMRRAIFQRWLIVLVLIFDTSATGASSSTSRSWLKLFCVYARAMPIELTFFSGSVLFFELLKVIVFRVCLGISNIFPCFNWLLFSIVVLTLVCEQNNPVMDRVFKYFCFCEMQMRGSKRFYCCWINYYWPWKWVDNWLVDLEMFL